jgi:hypothetical protein
VDKGWLKNRVKASPKGRLLVTATNEQQAVRPAQIPCNKKTLDYILNKKFKKISYLKQ